MGSTVGPRSPHPVPGRPARLYSRGTPADAAGGVDNRRTPRPGSATLPIRGPIPAGADAFVPKADLSGPRADAFVPGQVLVRFEAGTGEGRRRAAAAAVDGRVAVGNQVGIGQVGAGGGGGTGWSSWNRGRRARGCARAGRAA